MAITALYEGTATISTVEYSLPNAGTILTPKTDIGVFQLFLDLTAMATGDQYELRLYEKCRATDAQALVDIYTLTGGQTKPLLVLPSMIFMRGWDITLRKIAGTDRAFAWSIRQVA